MRKHTRFLPLILLVAALLIGGCAKSVSLSEKSDGTTYGASVPAPAADTEGARGVTDSYQYAEQTGAASERMIISTVDMLIVVDDTNITLTKLRDLVQAQEGFVADSQQWYSSEQPYARVTVRVPGARLNATLEAIRAMALRVERENISGQDVTEEYVNLDARVGNLEATEKELLALLTEVRENRGKAEEILAIYDKITAIRGEIESIKGRQKYLSTMSAMATITVEIQPKAAPAPVGKTEWDPMVTLGNAWGALLTAFKVIYDILAYLVVLSPIILIPAAILYGIVRLIRKRKQAK